jgi:hypothetical protein
MRTPSLVPRGDDPDVYLVVDDPSWLGRVWRETDVEATDYGMRNDLNAPRGDRPPRPNCPAGQARYALGASYGALRHRGG